MDGRSSILGIDLGGTKACLALVRTNGTIVDVSRFPIKNLFRIREDLMDQIDHFVRERQICGIGIGLKGMVSSNLRTILSSSILAPVLPWDLCMELESRYGVTVLADNDVHAATTAELLFGIGKTTDNFVYINVGTGLAIGIVSEGRLFRGQNNLAGEAGICLCRSREGQLYFLEDAASGGGLALEAARVNAKAGACSHVTGLEISRLAQQGDALALQAWNSVAENLARMVYNLYYLLDPKLFVLGGGVMSDGRMLASIQEQLELLSGHAGRPTKPLMSLSALGCDDVGVLGAASVWIVNAKNNQQ